MHPLLDYTQEPHWDLSDWQYHDLRDSDNEKGELPLTTVWQVVAHLLMPDLAAGFQGWSAEGHTGLHLALVAGVPLLTTEGSSGGDDVAAWVAAESYLPRRITTLDARSVRRTTRQTEMSLWISFEGSVHSAAPQLDRGDHIPELVSSDESDLDEMPDLVPPGLASIQRPSARAPEE